MESTGDWSSYSLGVCCKMFAVPQDLFQCGSADGNGAGRDHKERFMKMKLLALAVTGAAFSAPLMAQSNVQIYGIMDLGFSRLSDSDTGYIGAKFKPRNAIDSGNQAASRIGFRGTEDLGNGLSAFFTIEQGLSADTSSSPSSSRAIFVGLGGDFGRVSLGRHMNSVRKQVTDMDPFQAAGVGNMLNINRQTTWLNNSIQYTSPSFHGLTLGGNYSNNVGFEFLGIDFGLPSDEIAIPKGEDNVNTRLWNVVANYARGPISAGISYERLKNDAVGYKEKRWNLVGAYDFGVARVSATYGTVKNQYFDFLETKGKQWMIAATVPVSEIGTVLVSYNRSKRDVDFGPFDIGSLKGSQWAIGYNHALSKRTNVYATYAQSSANDFAETIGYYDVGPGSNGFESGNFHKGFNVGIRHNF